MQEQKGWARLLAGMLLVLSLAACSDDRKGQRQIEAPRVRVEQVVREDAGRVLQVVGNVKASASVGVVSRVTGEIVKVHFTEGQDVEEGQTLISLDDRPFVAQLREKEALLAKSRAQLVKARDDMRRYSELVKNGYVSREAYEATATEAAALKGTVQSDAAAVDSAALQVSYCTLTAPIGGRVGSLSVDKGNMVKENAETPLLTIHTISPCYVVFSVPEHNLSTIFERRAEGPVEVTATPLGGDPEKGELTLVENEVDTRTGTIRLRATFTNESRRLWPGQFVNVRLPLGTEKNALVLPTVAVQSGRDGTYVYRISPDGKAETVPVRVLFEFDGRCAVDAKLEAGDNIVVDGMIRLAPGVPVTIVQ